MKTSKHLDWLSITIPGDVNWRQFIPFVELSLQGKGRHGYGQCWVDGRTGARIETASTRDDMGTHLTLSGDVLQAMRDELGAVDDRIIERIAEYDGKCSRVDLALDCFGASLHPTFLNNALKDGSATMPARIWRFIDGHNNGVEGATIDTGSPKSDRRFRFYDKTAERRIKDGDAWVRLELQLRRLYAKSAISACGAYGTAQTVSTFIGGYLEWTNDEYQAVIGDRTPMEPMSSRQDGNRRRWLLGQVAKALASECLIEPYFRERFNQAVNGFLADMTNVDTGNKRV